MDVNSERLLLREFESGDLDALYALYTRPETIRYNPSGYPASKQAVKDLVESWTQQQALTVRRSYTLLIQDREDGHFIGVISLELGKDKYRNGEVWYKLDPGNWGLGFATEALKLMLVFGFHSLRLHRIECGSSVHNLGSIKVMEKAGMLREGISRALLPLEDGWHDGVIYAILENEFAG